ncbi:hypothetical protein BJY04DRAFT_226311 [Aspergillus karnatakaensis]|uniref:uncharacterized protein n=1 Tax=Aspergillus karnatakaensis TaxID=1810916 RepID=UPI003CCCDD66
MGSLPTSVASAANHQPHICSSLPSSTPRADGSTAAAIKNFLHLQLPPQRREPTSYVHFTNVPPEIVHRSSDHHAEIFGANLRITYDAGTRDLIVKIPSQPDESAHLSLSDAIVIQAVEMDLKYELCRHGAATVSSGNISKEPDSSFRPRPTRLPAGRVKTWPALVIEASSSEAIAHLRAMADLWIDMSNGNVKVAIIISIERARGTVIVEKGIPNRRRPGGLHAVRDQEIVVNRLDSGRAEVVGAPLVIGFEELFLRALAPGEGDIVVSGLDFENMAELVWDGLEL